MDNNSLKISTLLAKLESELKQLISKKKLKNPLMIGIHSGGGWIAEKLHHRLALQEPVGIIDISFYRDNFSQTETFSQVKPNLLPQQMEGRDIILIDDVFYTGRTARSALNEIFDYGRPRQVILAVLIEQEGREVPLRPDCSGQTLLLANNERINLTGPEPLALDIQSPDKQLTAA